MKNNRTAPQHITVRGAKVHNLKNIDVDIPLGKLVFSLVGTSSEIDSLTMTYFRICIWGAPAVMLTTALTGWFIGMQNTRIPMLVAIVQNLVNIPVSLFLVYCLGLKIDGVAFGTVIAQYVGLFIALMLRYKLFRSYCGFPHGISVIEWKEMRRFANVNKDIFLRTICLIAVTVFFTSVSARQGELVLAANTLLLQLFYFFSYVMDGFANSGEAISGRMYGAGHSAELFLLSKTLFVWGMAVMLCFTLVYLIAGIPFLSLLTNEGKVLNVAADYYIWVVFVPFAGFAAFLWDGIFIGLTMTAEMLLSDYKGKQKREEGSPLFPCGPLKTGTVQIVSVFIPRPPGSRNRTLCSPRGRGRSGAAPAGRPGG